MANVFTSLWVHGGLAWPGQGPSVKTLYLLSCTIDNYNSLGWVGEASTEHDEEVSWIINEAEMTFKSVVSQANQHHCNTAMGPA